jgi:NADPH-dependent F420 reductase
MNGLMEDAIAILGGTGAEGFGLALHWAKAGLKVRIGSRDAQKAVSAAGRVREAVPRAEVEGLVNAEAAAGARVVVLTVPLMAQISTIKAVRESLRPGTIFVDATVPVGAALGDRIAHLVTPWSGSAAQQAAAYLPAGVAAVSAFHALSAVALADLEHAVDCDVLICGDNAEAKAVVKQLAEKIPGARAVDAGPLENSRFAEHIAALLISLNLRYKVKHSGLRITGLP